MCMLVSTYREVRGKEDCGERGQGAALCRAAAEHSPRPVLLLGRLCTSSPSQLQAFKLLHLQLCLGLFAEKVGFVRSHARVARGVHEWQQRVATSLCVVAFWGGA
jgi:hypothetical protein